MTLNRAQNLGVDLNQLDRAGPALSRQNYLGNGNKKYIFLYHSLHRGQGHWHVFGVFLPNGPVRLHIVDSGKNRNDLPALQKTYKELLEKRRRTHGTSDSINYPSSHEFTHHYHGTDVAALKAISRELGLLEDKSYTVIISSMKDQTYFDAHIPKLAKFPVLSMSKAKGPHTPDAEMMHHSVTKKMISRYLLAGAWVDRMISLADYYDVPVGNIDGDQALFLADIGFARRLIQQDTVLWWSPGERPDLGGIENDSRPAEEFPNSEFHSPGSYSNVCLEVSLRNLAVNSVLHSVMVNELEGSGGATAFDSVSRTLDEYSNGETQRDITLGESNVSSQTFGILKSMIKSWLVDKIQGNFESPANLAIDHFWRWISSSVSQMYDPSIHRFIYGLMRKTFIQLLAEFRRLGSHVVYADFSRILLATSKPPGTAHAYATYITTAVTSHELFQHIYLNTERFYDFLLFMDQANMGGVVCEDPLAIEPPTEISMEMRWNIGQFLPSAIQKDFNAAVQFFILELFNAKRKSEQTVRAPLRNLQNAAPDATQPDAVKVVEQDSIKEFIARRLTRKLLKMVGNIQERYQNATGDGSTKEFVFPVLPGSHLHLTNPTLEFVKFVCATFGLAKEYQVEVGLLKRNMLELIGVREFASEAIFRNPCEPLRLSNVPCRHCDGLRDFDFCRDPELMKRWSCLSCGGEYDRTSIEMILVNMVHSLERTFAQQDLRCGKCKQIQSDNVSRYCQCSGSYQFTMNKVDVRRKLRTILNVANTYHLKNLKVCLFFHFYLNDVLMGSLNRIALRTRSTAGKVSIEAVILYSMFQYLHPP